MAALPLLEGGSAKAATVQGRYYARQAVEDRHGVIAPWYTGQNGQCDFRVRIAAETLKRYPWTTGKSAVAAAPAYLFNGCWKISPDGSISLPALTDWANGDLGQRAAYVLSGLVDYYRYSGDAAAIAHITILADMLCSEHWQTGVDHPWPRFFISVPNRGKPYGKSDPHGMIQLDIAAEAGLALVRAYELTGNNRWLETAKHWGDLLAAHRNPDPSQPPWNRYANPKDVKWNTLQTGGVVFLLEFFDELIRVGYTGAENQIVNARDAGLAHLRDNLLPRWTAHDVWGRNYWDWENPVQAENVTEFVCRYLMEHPAEFPNWQTDARNIMSLFLNRTGVNPKSNGDVYSGAWAYPEASNCCGRSLWYGPLELATVWAQYGVLAESEWARELARRQVILATYDAHDTGVVEDNIDGGQIVAGNWFKIAHPMALKHVLGSMAWFPEVLGAGRENHIMRSSSVIRSVVYGKGTITYSAFDAPVGSVDVLRLAFQPTSIVADGNPLPRRPDLKANGFRVEELPGGDCIVSIRRDGCTRIVIEGDDPQEAADDDRLTFDRSWAPDASPDDFGGKAFASDTSGASMTYSFTGNQVRLIGRVAPEGGLADVYLDEVKQLAGIDCWNPETRSQQVLYYKTGLPQGRHTLKITARGAGNALSQGSKVYVDAVQFSAATGNSGFGEGGGPTGPQRMIFGYTARRDFVDSAGSRWRPGTEFVVRAGPVVDSVAASWWTKPRGTDIAGTADPELYRYGVHAPEFWVNVTVAPGTYRVQLKFAETRDRVDPRKRAVTVHVNGREVAGEMDLAAKAGGFNKAFDLSLEDIHPKHGIIEIRFTGADGGEAMVQAIEVLSAPASKPVAPK